MPEGPSIVILKEATSSFVGQKIVSATGNSKKIEMQNLTGQVISDIKSWGKHFIISFPTFSIRIHFLMFGSYTINESKEKIQPRLSLQFSKGRSLNFYACSIIAVNQPLDEIYDWSTDVMSNEWNSRSALKKLRAIPTTLICDALLDQKIFSGVGNIIKNEVLFRVRVRPDSKVGKIPPAKRREIVREAVRYSFQFLEWKKAFTLKKHWLAHTKKICPRDANPIIKKYLGTTNRRSFYCPVCQRLYR